MRARSSRARLLGGAAILLSGALVLFPTAAAAKKGKSEEALGRPAEALPLPYSLRPAVEFWQQIYGRYGSKEVVIHDSVNLDIVYDTLDFRGLEKRSYTERRKRKIRRDRTETEKKKIRQALLRIHKYRNTPSRLTAREKKILDLFRKVSDPRKFQKAAHSDRVRGQGGLRDRFEEGVEISGRYMTHFERIFEGHGVPVELTRLPFVESTFNIRARSKRGAGGVWQFMPSTAKLFMRMDEAVDERYDPIIAADAAARLLRRNFEVVNSWPLAVTAYNTGIRHMERAMRQTGSRDIGVIVRRYRSRTFGFASRNFYAEFLAALEVDQNHRDYFGKVKKKQPMEYDAFVLPHYVRLADVLRGSGVTAAQVSSLNPAISSRALSSKVYLPKGFELKLPPGKGPRVVGAYAKLPSSKKKKRGELARFHRVRRGETLSVISRRYGVSVGTLVRTNRLRSRHRIRVGQRLRIPARLSSIASDETIRPVSVSVRADAPASGSRLVAESEARPVRDTNAGATVAKAPESPPPKLEKRVHVVRRGENLNAIAHRYGVHVSALQRTNGIRNRNRIYVGQRISVDGDSLEEVLRSGKPIIHRVRRGETLTKIARRYGVTISEIVRVNRLRSRNRIRVGQRLTVPGKAPPDPAPTPPSSSKPEEPSSEAPESTPEPKEGESPVDPQVEGQAARNGALVKLEFVDPPSEAAADPAGEVRVSKAEEDRGGQVRTARRPEGAVAITMEVESGETLRQIAGWCGASEAAIRKTNRLRMGSGLKIGQRLKLSCRRDLQEFLERRRAFHREIREKFRENYRVSSTVSHTVKKDQTLWRISQVYDVPVWLVEQYNRNRDLRRLRPGDSITIPVLASRL